jgi:hypothetical protein
MILASAGAMEFGNVGGSTNTTSMNLTTSGAMTLTSSAINCAGQIIPAYAYNATTGVSNTGAIGYTKFGTPSTASGLVSGGVPIRSSLTIGVDGVYLINSNRKKCSRSKLGIYS